jgi:oligopeptide transport system substrate-binding protein
MAQVGMVGLDNTTLAPVPEAITRLPSLSNGDVSPDGLSCTFHIKPNLKFSNGDPITARTFAYSIERSMSWEVGKAVDIAWSFLGELKGATAYIQATYANGDLNPALPSISPTDPVNGIKGAGRAINVVDPLTLVLTLQTAEAATLFFEWLTFPLAWAVDEAYAPANPFQPGNSGADFNHNWANANPSAIPASGSFMIQSFTSAQSVVMVSNPNWFGPALTLTQVTIPLAASAPAAFAAHQAGQYDISPVGIGDIPTASALPKGEYNVARSLTTTYVSMNWLDPFLGDSLVRQAFAETIDRAAIAKSLRGDSVVASEHFVPRGMPGYNSNLTGFGFNPVDARAKLQQAITQHGVQIPSNIVFEYAQGANVTRNAEVSLIINDWSLYLGGTVTPSPKTVNELVTDLQNSVGNDSVQMYMLGWAADYPDPNDFLTILWGQHSPFSGNNATPTDAWALATQADADQNSKERYSLYNQAEQLMVNEVVATTVYESLNPYVVKPWVSRYNLKNFFLAPDTWAKVQILAH